VSSVQCPVYYCTFCRTRWLCLYASVECWIHASVECWIHAFVRVPTRVRDSRGVNCYVNSQLVKDLDITSGCCVQFHETSNCQSPGSCSEVPGMLALCQGFPAQGRLLDMPCCFSADGAATQRPPHAVVQLHDLERAIEEVREHTAGGGLVIAACCHSRAKSSCVGTANLYSTSTAGTGHCWGYTSHH